ncbi:MAG: FAD-dependent oxidoreductase [Clostridia bacterium]|nr:FAD-dependent oxidoreductase [Clostridia bacterium]
MNKRIVIIGSGPAGLICALSCCQNGIEPSDILIIERDSELGGTLNQCIHSGFGKNYLEEVVTGTELASMLSDAIRQLEIEYITDSTVLFVDKQKRIRVVSPKYGYCTIKAEAIVLAMGCREKTKGALQIGGTRPAGVFSAGAVQRIVNLKGYMPGKKTVVLGSGDLAMIVARRLVLEGGSVACVCEPKEYAEGSEEHVAECLENFEIPLYYSTTVTKIFGKERIEAVEIAKVDKRGKAIKGTEQKIKCDSFVYQCGLVPENEIIKETGIRLDTRTRGAYVNQYFETNVKGIFTCGNAVRIHDLVDFIVEEAQIVGESVKKYLDNKTAKPISTVRIKNSDKILYSVPQHLDEYDEGIEDCVIYFRVNGKYDNLLITLKKDGEEIYSREKGKMSWLETGKILVTKELSEKIKGAKEIIICAQEKKNGNDTDNNS